MKRSMKFTLVVALTSLMVWAAPAGAPGLHWYAVARGSLCVTEGVVSEAADHRLLVEVPKMRAYLNRWSAQAIEARFTYLGPTAREIPLGSGSMRCQFGFKLYAQDACNLVYAMWRFVPKSEVIVSVKSNPGQHSSAECGNRGYRNVKAVEVLTPPPIHAGEAHTFRVERKGEELAVFIDNAPVWKGDLGSEALAFSGPVGIRSDNARLELELQAGGTTGPRPNYVLACRSDAGEQE